MVTYQKSASWVPPKWVKSNAWREREKEERVKVSTMAGYACERHGGARKPPGPNIKISISWLFEYNLPLNWSL